MAKDESMNTILLETLEDLAGLTEAEIDAALAAPPAQDWSEIGDEDGGRGRLVPRLAYSSTLG